MSRRDKHHDKVKQALIREGWTITHDPYFFQTDPKLATDLGAERLLAAELVFDDERGRYMVMWLGWQGQRRIHSCYVHIDIVDEKILIQWNDTEELLDEILVDMGVPRSVIVIGTIPPELCETMEDSLSCSEAA